MTHADLSRYTIGPDATLLDAAKAIDAGKARTVVVVEDFERLKVLGILSEGDILRALVSGADVMSPIREHVQVSFAYLSSMDYDQAYKLFAAKGFALIPVVDNDLHLTGVITLMDCLQRKS